MKTYEMVVLADEDEKTYRTGHMRYQKRKGFHDEDGREWRARAYESENGLSRFIHADNWYEIIK